MNFELRNIKYLAAMSEETSCYSARLYLDGKPVADVGNRGHGGCDEQRPLNGASLADLETAIRAAYPVEVIDGLRLEPSLESVCGDLLDRYLTIRDLRRHAKTKVLFLAPGESGKGGTFRTVKMRPTDTVERVAAWINGKYPGATIANTLTDDQLFALVR